MIRKDLEELGKKGGMCWPRGRGDEVPIGDRLGDFERNESRSGEFDLWSTGRVGIDAFPGDDAGGGEDLGTMTVGGDGLVGAVEVTNDLEYSGIEAEILGRATSRYNETVVVFVMDVVEGGVESEVMAWLF